jgi:Holliday junction resolvasome RuvABC DNA-binding subunit
MQLILGKKDISNTYKESNTNSLKYNFTNVEEQFLDVVEDSISALVNLGYTRSEVFSVVMNIKRDFNLKKVSIDFTVNSVIPLALKELSKVVK